MPHVVQANANMFSVFLGEALAHVDAVRDFAGAATQDATAYSAFFHSMLEQGVYLPPSSYETWFLSSAHTDDDLEQVVDALPAAARAAGSAMGGLRWTRLTAPLHLRRPCT